MVIPGPYCHDIMAQPAALEATLASLDTAAVSNLASRWRDGRFDRVVLTAMGGSYWALHPLHLELLTRGACSLLVETSELIHVLPSLLGERVLLIVCSQSGRSAEILRLLDLQPPGCFTLAVTNTEASPLAERADAALFTRAGVEATVSSKTYVTALMALQWFAGTIFGVSSEQSRDELSRAAPAAAGYLRDWEDHVRAIEAQVAGVRDVFVLGRGPSQAAAGIGGLMVKESTHLHGEGMSAAAFRHGPWEMLHPDLFALVMAGAGPTAELARHLVRDIVHEGARAALVSPDAPAAAFRLPAVPASIRPIVEILPVQMLTLALASLAGREAGKFERATKITTGE
jgi:glucosamine--fructose-6-phosphate aminotransferase (isomerizing)